MKRGGERRNFFFSTEIWMITKKDLSEKYHFYDFPCFAKWIPTTLISLMSHVNLLMRATATLVSHKHHTAAALKAWNASHFFTGKNYVLRYSCAFISTCILHIYFYTCFWAELRISIEVKIQIVNLHDWGGFDWFSMKLKMMENLNSKISSNWVRLRLRFEKYFVFLTSFGMYLSIETFTYKTATSFFDWWAKERTLKYYTYCIWNISLKRVDIVVNHILQNNVWCTLYNLYILIE